MWLAKQFTSPNLPKQVSIMKDWKRTHVFLLRGCWMGDGPSSNTSVIRHIIRLIIVIKRITMSDNKWNRPKTFNHSRNRNYSVQP